jgi:sugar phosphate isomerase/epimerase
MIESQVTRRGFLGRSLAAGAAGVASAQIATGVAAAEAQQGDPWQVGIFTRPWHKHDYRVALDAMAEAGFEYAGLMSAKLQGRTLLVSVKTSLDEARQIGDEAKKRGLKVASVYGGPIPVGESLEAGIAGMRKLIGNCVAAGCESLLMGGIGNKNLYETYYKAVAECCDYAAENDLAVVMKPHGGLNATGPQCRESMEMVGKKNFHLWYDPGNIFYYSDGKLDPVEDAATVDSLVTGMCVKDYKYPKNVEVTPGTGQVNFPGVMDRLKKGGFTGGSLIIETLDPGDLAQTLRQARQARRFVEELVSQKK